MRGWAAGPRSPRHDRLGHRRPEQQRSVAQGVEEGPAKAEFDRRRHELLPIARRSAEMTAKLVEIDEFAERACDLSVLEQMDRDMQRHMGRAEHSRTVCEAY